MRSRFPRFVVVFLLLAGGRLLAADAIPGDAWTRLPPPPRLLATAERFAALRQQCETDPVSRQLAQRLRARADAILQEGPVPFQDVGSFLVGDTRRAQVRILTLGLAYRLFGERAHLARARAEMQALAGLSDWMPSHFLGTAEAAFGLGIGLDWLHAELSPIERQNFTKAIVEKALLPSIHGGRNNPYGGASMMIPNGNGFQWRWITLGNNWNQVCHGGLVVGALAVAGDEPRLARQIVERALANLHYAGENYAPDGVWSEGPGYWKYGTTFHALLIEALRSAFGTAFGMDRFAGFLASADFVAHTHGPGGLPFNFADARARPPGFDGTLFWFAREAGRRDHVDASLALLERLPAGGPDIGERDLPLALLWWNPALAETAPAPRPLDWLGRGTCPVAVHRSAWNDPRAVFVALKGGTPNSSHAHMDVGSFIFEADGVRWAIDPGGDSYPLARAAGIELWSYAQESPRWSLFRAGPEGHNILRVNGEPQAVDGVATDLRSVRRPDARGSVLDLTPVYRRQVQSIRRGILLGAERRVLFQDEWTAAERPVTVAWQWLTEAAVRPVAGGVELQQAGERLRLRVLEPQGAEIRVEDVSFSKRAWDSPNPNLSRLVIVAGTPRRAAGRIAVVAEPVTAAPAGLPLSPLGEW